MTPKETPPLPATPPPLSAEEIAGHQPAYRPIVDNALRCGRCWQAWPCDASRLAAERIAATARVEGPMSAEKVLSWLHERVAALAEAPARPPVLDAAWAEAEAALPNLWPSHRVGGGVDHWNATATADGPRKGWTGEGPTPAAALRALAARLAEPRIPQASEPRTPDTIEDHGIVFGDPDA